VATTDDDTFMVEMEYSTVVQGAPEDELAGGTPANMMPQGSPVPASLLLSPASDMAEGGGGQEGEPNLPPIVREEDLDVDHDDEAPLRVLSINDIIRLAQSVG
jgi:hypothetical protein